MQNYKELRAEMRRKISNGLINEKNLSNEDLQELISDEVNLALLGRQVDLTIRRRLIAELFNSFRGLDILQGFMDASEVTEIMVNGPDEIFIEQGGRITRTDLSFDNALHLQDVITHFFSKADKNINYSSPIADLRLADGSRANAVLPPIAPSGPILTIRKFTGIKPTANELVAQQFISPQALHILQQAVEAKRSIFICGGTGTGKTTLLNVLSNFIPAEERVITIEDSAELQLQNLPNLVRLEARQGSAESETVDITKLIRTALRMRPDRIIVGEVRGAEAFDMLSAMNSGHPGTLCTGHANSCADMLLRLANLILSACSLPYSAIKENLAAALDLMVHISRNPDGHRYVDELCQIKTEANGSYHLENLLL